MTKSKKTRKKEARKQEAQIGPWLPSRGGFIAVGVVSLALTVWTAIQAARALPLLESILWGLGCIFVPFVSLIFLIMHWDTAGKPFLIQLAGVVAVIAASVMIGPSA